jgi:hypothetical protein
VLVTPIEVTVYCHCIPIWSPSDALKYETIKLEDGETRRASIFLSGRTMKPRKRKRTHFEHVH